MGEAVTKEEIKSKCEALDKAEKPLNDALSEIHDARRALIPEWLREVYSLAPDVIVKTPGGKLHKAVRFEHVSLGQEEKWNRPWVIASPQKKDGTFGTAQRNLFRDWEIVK